MKTEMKVWEFLSQMDSHHIYGQAGLAKEFMQRTGQEPCWRTHTAAGIARMIEERGLGGSLKDGDPERLMANAWEIAEALAEKLAPGHCTHHLYEGRGRRFRAAVAALRKAGV